MKVIGARWNKDNNCYSIDYDDGITVFVNEQYEKEGMLSTGLDSYYLKHMKWPAGKNLSTRLELAKVWIDKNKNRYKSKK